MKYFVIFGLLLTILASIGFAQPTSAQMMCAGGDEQFHFTINDVVFIGTVTAINPSDSHPLWNYISFDIQYSFKGLTNQTEIVVPTYEGSTYGFEPEIGSKYLMHASKAYGVDLFTSLCSDNKLLDTEQDVEDMKNQLLEMNTLTPLKQKQYGISSHAIKCKQNLVLIQKYDGSPACVKPESIPKLIERGWAKNDDYPFGITGPVMSQESCDAHLLSQWQPTLEGREMVQQFLKQCIQRGFTTPELVERGKIADNFTYGPIQTAIKSAQGDIEKTIEILEEMYVEKTNENLEDVGEDNITSVVHVGVDKEEYHTDDVVIISGYVEKIVPNTELNITVRNPLMDVVFVSQVKISEEGIFTESLPIGGSLWRQNGIYTVFAQYGNTTNHTDFLYLSDLESDDLL